MKKFTQDELDNHDCHLSEEDSCDCVNAQVEDERDEHEISDDELENEDDHLEELDKACINDYSRDE